MKFPYLAVEGEPTTRWPDGVIHRPMVRAQLIGTRDSAIVWALLDTGADETLLPLSLAEGLGVTLEQERSLIEGYGGKTVEIIAGELDLVISDGREMFQWTAAVQFADLPNPEDEMLLFGRRGCLEFFRACFDGESKETELVPNLSFPGVIEK